MSNPMFWKEYINMEDQRVYGYFNKKFSEKIALGRIKKVNEKKYEAVFALDPGHEEVCKTFDDAKEWVEQQMLLWVMRGNTLAPYLNNKVDDEEDE